MNEKIKSLLPGLKTIGITAAGVAGVILLAYLSNRFYAGIQWWRNLLYMLFAISSIIAAWMKLPQILRG